MPGGQKVAAQHADPVQQGAELHGAVALRAGIGGAAPLVLLDKIPNDGIPEDRREVKHIEGEAQPPGHLGGVLRVLQGAAGFVPALPQVLVVEHPQIHTGELMPCLLQQNRRHRAVHTAAHGHKYMGHRSASFLYRCYCSSLR